MIDFNLIKFEDVLLMKKRIAQRLKFSPEQLRVSYYNDGTQFLEDLVVVEINAFLYGQDYNKEVVLEVQTYETWFDHWLDSSCPKWLSRYFDIKMKTIRKTESVEFEVLYPNFYPATGKDDEHVVIRRTVR
jgi:hypothetical protein